MRLTSILLLCFVLLFLFLQLNTLIRDKTLQKSPRLETQEMSSQLESDTEESLQKKWTKCSKPLLTMFTTWNDNPEKYLVHNLTTRNWMKFRPHIIPVVFTDDSSIKKECQNKKWNVMPVSQTAADGVPLLKNMYIDAMKQYDSLLYAYVNSDILFTESLLLTLKFVIHNYVDVSEPLLVVGSKTDVDFVTELEGSSWDNITEVARSRGVLHRDVAVDYFITSRSFPWNDIAPVIVGRMTYDNYLLFYSRKTNITTIDTTKTILAVHQTTAAGKYEGFTHNNSEFNLHLLERMLKTDKFRFEGIGNITRYTYYHQSNIKLGFRNFDRR